MRGRRSALSQVVDSVADGSADIDWEGLTEQVRDERNLDLLRQLRVLAQLSDVQRVEADRIDEDALKASARAIARKRARAMPAPPATTERLALAPPQTNLATLPVRYWGRLELYNRLGEGSFGEVFRAFDPQLQREVAVKLLHAGKPQALTRILDEARALARVRHENVVVVHNAEMRDGRVGLCMEYIRGKTLAALLAANGRMGSTEATTIGLALCRALAAVHKQALLHRDIKAQNVMREEGGRVVLMDFGAGHRRDAAVDDAMRLTGTPLYLAPEVLQGGKATEQSDIYSLGVLLFHLVTDDYPVNGTSIDELKAGHREGRRTHLHDVRPDLSDAFVRCLERAIDPDPLKRYRTAGEFGEALGDRATPRPITWKPWVALAAAVLVCTIGVSIGLLSSIGRPRSWLAGASDGRPVIAVLPLEHTRDIEDYVAADITDSISQALSVVDGLVVISRTSVNTARQANASLPQIARSVGADLVLEGRISRAAGDALTASVSLVRAPRDQTLLARRFQFTLPAIGRLQRDVLRAVCDHLNIAIDPKVAHRSGIAGVARGDARELYARGRYALATFTDTGRDEAIEYFSRAIDADPAFALAHAGLGQAYLRTTRPSMMTVSYELAERAAERALSLDSSLADAHAVLADVRTLKDWDWTLAEMEFQKAIALAPSLSTGHRYAMLLAARGKPEQALARILEEQRLDPLSPMVAVSIATILQFNGRFQEAYGQAVKAQELRAENPVISIVKGRILTALGRFDEARAAFRTALAQGATEGPAYIDSELAAIDAASGRRDAALTALPGLETLATTGQLDATMVAFVHGRLGQVDAAYSWLDRAYAERSVRLVWMRVDPRFKPLARDPRFDELVKRMRLD